jgi:hypothetical protein
MEAIQDNNEQLSENESDKTRKSSKKKKLVVDESKRDDLRDSFNDRISSLCCFAALFIAVISFGTIIVEAENSHYVILGLSLAIALLAIAVLQKRTTKK